MAVAGIISDVFSLVINIKGNDRPRLPTCLREKEQREHTYYATELEDGLSVASVPHYPPGWILSSWLVST